MRVIEGTHNYVWRASEQQMQIVAPSITLVYQENPFCVPVLVSVCVCVLEHLTAYIGHNIHAQLRLISQTKQGNKLLSSVNEVYPFLWSSFLLFICFVFFYTPYPLVIVAKGYFSYADKFSTKFSLDCSKQL